MEVTNVDEAGRRGRAVGAAAPGLYFDHGRLRRWRGTNPFVDAEGVANTDIVDPDKNKSGQNTTIPEADVKWQWSRSSSQGGTYTDIPGDSAKGLPTSRTRRMRTGTFG